MIINIFYFLELFSAIFSVDVRVFWGLSSNNFITFFA